MFPASWSRNRRWSCTAAPAALPAAKHIFTHIVWDMRGIYASVREKTEEFVWMTPEEINAQAALPTAFRLFWEETENV